MTKRLRKEPSLNPKPTPPIPKSEGGAQMKKRLNRRRNTALGPKGTKQIEPKIKSEPPTLTNKVTARAGYRHGRAGLSTHHSGERIIANAENKKKLGSQKISKIRKAFARVPLAAFRLGGGGGGGAGRK